MHRHYPLAPRTPIYLVQRTVNSAEAASVASKPVPSPDLSARFQLVLTTTGPGPVDVRVAVETSVDTALWQEVVRFSDATGPGAWIALTRGSADATIDLTPINPSNLAIPVTDGYVFHGPPGTQFRAVSRVVSLAPGTTVRLELQLVTSP